MTTDCGAVERKITHALGDLRPVAVAYLETAPEGVAKFEGTVPSGCSFWSLAAHGSFRNPAGPPLYRVEPAFSRRSRSRNSSSTAREDLR